MLRSLNIKNLALVDDVKVHFSEGLNIITGETGAGKSLLIGALRLLLGERADKSMIRTGAPSCSVQAQFELKDCRRVDSLLTEIGLDACTDGLLIVRRVITENTSKAVINDEPVTLQVLKKLGRLLVDLHGPYDHQSLFDTAVQLDILDAFGQVDQEKEGYRALYDKWKKVRREMAELNDINEEGLAQRIEFLTYRTEEIEAARISVEEDAEVTEEHSTAAHAQQILELANHTVLALTEGEQSAFESLASAQRSLGRLSELLSEAKDWSGEVESAIMQVQEVVRSIEQAVAGMDASPERMQWLDERLSTYQNLKRKYGGSVEEILENQTAWNTELLELKNRDRRCEALQLELDALMQELEKAGAVLHQKRENVADHLSECITRELIDIGFEHGFFDVQLLADEPGPEGLDRVEFGFAPNAGEDMRPLRMIASSGEISRVMLATKTVLSRQDAVPVLIFDEIDANIGGETGVAVGQKLRQVAGNHQLISITHLPQVAAFGSVHLAVRKHVKEGRTFTEVTRLDEADRPEELARMLGGKDNTQVTLQHAQELLDASR